MAPKGISEFPWSLGWSALHTHSLAMRWNDGAISHTVHHQHSAAPHMTSRDNLWDRVFLAWRCDMLPGNNEPRKLHTSMKARQERMRNNTYWVDLWNLCNNVSDQELGKTECVFHKMRQCLSTPWSPKYRHSVAKSISVIPAFLCSPPHSSVCRRDPCISTAAKCIIVTGSLQECLRGCGV